ncbi:MAG: lysine--tRNA ligase [bacterium]|nr:lysine--tRNA ligase [bacterium]
MASLDEIRATRLAKLKLLQDKGLNPYPVSARMDVTLREATEGFPKLLKKKELYLVGRVMALRGQGGLVFADLFDGTGKFQALLKKDEIGDELFDLWSTTVDIGDFVEVAGTLFLTKRNEKTLQVKKWRMLSKSLRPLPEKWHGLTDVEERFRKRYLDTLMNEEVRNRFILRSRIISALRASLDKEGFLEVETSMLQSLAGGASAEPFTTHHNALDINLNLRIAPELDLKKLLIGGYPKIYEIGRSFRNEGIDVTHNPEFTTIEWYEAYSDAERERAFIEKMFRALVKQVKGEMTITFDGATVDFEKPFSVLTYFEALQRYALIPTPEKATLDELSLKAKQLGVSVAPSDSAQKIMDSIFKKAVRPKLLQPTYVISYPKGMIPLAKEEEKGGGIDAFQFYAGGLELIKAFSELNDPIEQARRFNTEEGNRKVGDKEAQPNDKDFVEALEYGMPPAGGVGMGIERLMMLLSDVKNIREVIFFPTLRPKSE